MTTLKIDVDPESGKKTVTLGRLEKNSLVIASGAAACYADVLDDGPVKVRIGKIAVENKWLSDYTNGDLKPE